MDPANLIHIIIFLLSCYRASGVAMPGSRPHPQTNGPGERTVILGDPCSMVQQFAKDEAAFSTCAITSGNNMCKKCVSEIRELMNTYTKLMADEIRIKYADSKCLEAIVSDVSRERFTTYYTHSRQMWFLNNCDNCYSESTANMTEDVQRLFDVALEFDMCLEAHRNDTCDACQRQYSTLNAWYVRIEDDYQGNVCLDVTAVMVNYRGKWFSLGCISPLTFDVIAIAIGSGVILLCFLVYVGSRMFARMERPELLIQKRLSMMGNRSVAGSSYEATTSSDERTHLLQASVIP